MENKFEVNDVIVDRVSKYTYSVLYVNNHEQTYGLLNHTDVYEFTALWSDVDNFADLRSDIGYSYPLRDEDGEIVTTPMPKIKLVYTGTESLECVHEFVDTGLMTSYCKHCDNKGNWDRNEFKYISET